MVAEAITLRGVGKRFGALQAVDRVDLDIHRGEILGLIGRNGAGKSTLFKMMLGLLEPSAGEIRIHGQPVGGARFREMRRQIGYLPENVVLYDNLDGLETLRFFARLKGVPRQECAPLLERVGLSHAARRPVREYSKGMRQRLGFAQALLGTPRVLFLDEPTNGLDPQAIRELYARLETLKSEGVTIIITSHILFELQERVDRLAILEGGQLKACGSVASLREQMRLPLDIEVVTAEAARQQVFDALQAVGPYAAERTAGGWRFSCPPQDKMAVLAALVPLGEAVRDLRIDEPSLEDVFFGLSAATTATTNPPAAVAS